MAITLRSMIEQTTQKYHLKQLCGSAYLDHVVTWVHMAEDASVSEFFWGNELVVTSGFFSQRTDSLIPFISTLAEHRCAGIVINTGKYIETISPAVIAYCDEIGIPLFTMPWEMSITEFVRDSCFLINKSNRDEADLIQDVIHAINSPLESARYQQSLRERFDIESPFLLIAIHSNQQERDHILDQRRTLRIHTAMQPFNLPYLIFQHEKRFFVLLSDTNPSTAKKIADYALDVIGTALPNLTVRIGIGDPFSGVEHLCDCYHSAVSAVRCAELQNIPTVLFRDMGFYRLLYSVPDDALLESYFSQTLRPILTYDEAHKGSYTETLFRYILSGGSLQQVASEMFTHRNTVSYRMTKIRELLHDPLETPEDYLPYLIAYHSGLILKLIAPLS